MILNKNILISGAGISGLTLAYWLREHGFAPTIIEKRPNLNDRGYMIDFYGSGYDVADKMGIIAELQIKSDQYPISRIEFVDRNGKPRASLDVDKFREVLNQRYLPLMRGDLEAVIYESVRHIGSIRFGTSIRRLERRDEAVEVEFANGKTETFDLVIGAGGIHSNVRQLLWGDESHFSHYLGFYVACSVIDNFFDTGNTFLGHFEPNVQASVYSIGHNRLATFFAFRSDKLGTLTRDEQKELLAKKLDGLGWVIPQLLEGTRQAEDFFFDAAAQIQLDNWYEGRVALVGDACQCLTLLAGQGASMGMAGGYLLAEELHRAGGDHKVAFPAYQRRLKPEIDRRQRQARGLAGSFVPRNRFEIAMTHLLFNVALLPGFSSLFARQIGARSLIG
ncbi:MAG TPA: FAD-dependent monooxygenase [Gemmatimonadales bacterium]|nr:FAD-dependent monooxygenase [Gemmatimonadales bacterium]